MEDYITHPPCAALVNIANALSIFASGFDHAATFRPWFVVAMSFLTAR
jgi:hypothetical protein